MKTNRQKKTLSGFSLFSGSTLAMAFSLLAVIFLLIWWQSLLTRHLEVQYRFFAAQVIASQPASADLQRLIRDQDEKLAAQLFPRGEGAPAAAEAAQLIHNRLANRQKMVLYERTFFILLLLSGHLFFVYIYFRERMRRKLTEETILLATHELRQPLQSLSLALETAQHSAKGKSRTAIESGLTDINRLGQHIRWLAGSFAGEKQTTEISEIGAFPSYLEKLLKEEFTPAEVARITIHSGFSGAVKIRLSEPLLRFVVRNLTENALKYAHGNVELTTELRGRKLVLCVKNRGEKLAPGIFSRLGNVFFRSPSASVQNKSGFGLGLYLCGRIIRRARGRLTLENDSSGNTIGEIILKTV